jgi:outer membrane receptor protein involved in Fe transport
MHRRIAHALLAAGAILLAGTADFASLAQAPLPEITVTPPQPKPKAKAPESKKKASAPPAAPVAAAPQPVAAVESATVAANKTFDAARDDFLLPKIGANASYPVTHQDIEGLPQGTNQPIDKVILQLPGVTQDSAAQGALHVRNDHANLQYRLNGIIIPDGVSGFGQLLETSFVGSLSLITGALPAQYGLRNTGLIDIQSRTAPAVPEGTVSLYGGSHASITPSIEYGGTSGRTEYFFASRGFFTDLGLENPTSHYDAIHDQSQQGRAFGYASRLLDATTRLVAMSGVAIIKYQIPNNPGQPTVALAPSANPDPFADANSANIDQRQLERNFYNVLALQKKLDGADWQIAYFSRYSDVHFKPDPFGDLAFNGVASDVYRSSLLNGLQGDAAYRLSPAHTLRTGFVVSGETTEATSKDIVLQADATGTAINPLDASPVGVVDSHSKLGWLLGYYVQDEWKLTDRLILNAGLRFDQMYQFVDANQLSPRASLTWKPLDGTTLHVGYARYFTPPEQVIAGPTNIALFTGTTQQPACPPLPQPCNSPVLPERSHYYDAGIVQKFGGLELGVDAYRKIARDLLDDGQFGQAYVLNAFNYAKGHNNGVEFTAKYQVENFRAYANVAWGIQKATDVVSGQFRFTPDDLNFIATHYIYTDHAQTWTGSAGLSYLWNGTRFSTDMIFGSGLRNGTDNITHLPFYTQVNAGISHEFKWDDGTKPTTLRFDVLNVFDEVYEIRDGTGIGVFAPQFGPRRAYYIGLAQKF